MTDPARSKVKIRLWQLARDLDLRKASEKALFRSMVEKTIGRSSPSDFTTIDRKTELSLRAEWAKRSQKSVPARKQPAKEPDEPPGLFAASDVDSDESAGSKDEAGMRVWQIFRHLGVTDTSDERWLRSKIGQWLGVEKPSNFTVVDIETLRVIEEYWEAHKGHLAELVTKSADTSMTPGKKGGTTTGSKTKRREGRQPTSRPRDDESTIRFWELEKELGLSEEGDRIWLKNRVATLTGQKNPNKLFGIDAENADRVRTAWKRRNHSKNATPTTRGKSVMNPFREPTPSDSLPESSSRRLEAPESDSITKATATFRTRWTPSPRLIRDRSLESIAIVTAALIPAFGANLAWNANPAIAEWLVTNGVHRHGVIILGILAAISLIPDARLGEDDRWRIGGRLSLALVRGLAIGTLWTAISFNQGDLWNRSHEIAVILLVIMAVGVLRPWDLMGVPLRFLLGRLVGAPIGTVTKRLTHGLANFYLDVLSAEPDHGSLSRHVQGILVGGSPPQWFMIALERRLARLGRRITDVDGCSELDREEFEKLAMFELRLGVFQTGRDRERTLAVATDRVAECLLTLLRSSSPDDDEVDSERLTPLLEALWVLGSETLPEDDRGLRLLAAAIRPASTRTTSDVLHFAFEAKPAQLGTAQENGLATIGLGHLALRLNEERISGWAEGITRRLEGSWNADLTAGGPLHDLILAIRGRALAVQLPPSTAETGESSDPDIRRMLTEARIGTEQTGDRGLARVLPRTPVPHGRHRLHRISPTVLTRAALLPTERTGLHGSFPIGLVLPGVFLLALLVTFGWFFNDRTTTLASAVVSITDPFRPGPSVARAIEVSSATVDDSSGNLLVGHPDGVRVFDSNVFKFSDESIGADGPSGPVAKLAPISGGGAFTLVGDAPRGVDLRSADGEWDRVIELPATDLGTRDVLNAARESPDTILILTTEGILRYHESRRMLEPVDVQPPLPDGCVDWTVADGDIMVLVSTGLVRLEKSGTLFRASPLVMPRSLGEAVDLSSSASSFLIQTTNDALISFESDGRWTILAGGRQFEDSMATTTGLIVNPASDSILTTVEDAGAHGIRIRPAGLRHWRHGFLPEGIRIGEEPPLLAPAGDRALIGDHAGDLWLASPSDVDPLALDFKRVLPNAKLTSMSTITSGFTLVVRTPIGIELRSGDWNSLAGLGDRIRTVRPVEVREELIAALPHPDLEDRMLLVDAGGGVVEYDRTLRSMVGDRLQLLGDDEQPCERVLAATLATGELIVTLAEGVIRSYPDPCLLGAGEPAGVLRPKRAVLPTFASRPNRRISNLRDTDAGFEVLDRSGDAWEYDLSFGWRDSSTRVPGEIVARSVRRLQSGMIVAMCSDGFVAFRGPTDWEKTDIRFEEMIPCTNGLGGIDEENRTVVVRQDRFGRPVPEVVFEPPNSAGLKFPLHDALFLESGDLWIAHAGGISVYHPGGGDRWTRPEVDAVGYVRLESAGSAVYAESKSARLWSVDPKKERGTLLMGKCLSWSPTGDGRIIALDDQHQVRLFDGNRGKTLISGEAGRRSGRPVSATCSSDAAWVLESEHLYRVEPDGSVDTIDLPAPGGRMLAANSDVLQVLIEDDVHAYDRKSGKWLPTVVSGVERIVELPGLVVAADRNRGIRLIDPLNRTVALLPGSNARRARPLLPSGRLLEDDAGLWMQAESGILRWLPRGRGGFLPSDPTGTFQLADDRTFHLRASDVVELVDSPEGPASIRITDRPADQLFEYDDSLAFVSDESIHVVTPDPDRRGSVFFGPPKDDSDRIVDLTNSPSGPPVALSNQGTLLWYDDGDRRTRVLGDSQIRSDSARIDAPGDGLWLVSDEKSERLELFSRNGFRLQSDVTSWAMLQSQVMAITREGRIIRGNIEGWRDLGDPRPRAPVTPLRSHAPLGGNSMVLLTESGRLLSRLNRQSGVRAVVNQEGRYDRLHSLVDGRVLAARENQSVSAPLLVGTSGRGRRLPISRVIDGPQEPQLLLLGGEKLTNLDGDLLWSLDDVRFDLKRLRHSRDAGDARRCFNIDSQGRLIEFALDRVGGKVLGEFDVDSVVGLGLDLNGEPAVVTTTTIERLRGPAFDRAPGTRAITLDRGIAWIDSDHRLRIDERIAESRIPNQGPSDRFRIDTERVRRFAIGSLSLIADGDRAWQVDEVSGRLREVAFSPRDDLVVLTRDSSVLSESDSGVLRLLSPSGVRDLPAPPMGFSDPIIFREKLFASATDEDRLASIDIEDPDAVWKDVALDPNLPRGIAVVHPLPHRRHCIGLPSDGSVWRRSGFRRWEMIAGPGTISTSDARELQVRKTSEFLRDEVVISQHESGRPMVAWLFDGTDLLASMRQTDALEITFEDGTTERFQAEMLGTPPKILADFQPASVTSEAWATVRRGLEALASEMPVNAATVSGSGLVNSVDDLQVSGDEISLEVSVTDLRDQVRAISDPRLPELTGNAGWSMRSISSTDVGTDGTWLNLGDRRNPILIRRSDGLLKARAPRDLTSIGANVFSITRFDGSTETVTIERSKVSDPVFKLGHAGSDSLFYRNELGWQRFHSPDYSSAVVDTPAVFDGCLAHREGLGTWHIDANGDLWFRPDGSSNRIAIDLPNGSRARTLDWTSVKDGDPTLVVRTDTTSFEVTTTRALDRRAPIDAAERETLVRGGLEWRPGEAQPRFDGEVVQLRDRRFDHEIPTGLVAEGPRLFADVLVGGVQKQRSLSIGTGGLSGPLLDPVDAAVRSDETASIAAGEMKLDRGTGTLTLTTPRRDGDDHIEFGWTPSRGAFRVDRVERFLSITDGWIQITPDGLVLGLPPDFTTSRILSRENVSSAIDLRRGADESVDVLRRDGTILRWRSIGAAPSLVSKADSAFADDGNGVDAPLDGVVDRAFAKFRRNDATAPASSEWLPDDGAFTFEIFDPDDVDQLAVDASRRFVLTPTLCAELWFDRQGRPKSTDSDLAALKADPLTSTLAGEIRIDRRNFQSRRSDPALSFAGSEESESRLQVPWDLTDGLLPHRTFKALVPFGSTDSAAISRSGIHPIDTGRIGDPTLRFETLRERPDIRLVDGLKGCQAWYGDTGFEVTPSSGMRRLPARTVKQGTAYATDIAPGRPRVRVRRGASTRGRSFEITVEDDRGRTPLTLNVDGFLLDRPVERMLDDHGHLITNERRDTIFRIDSGSSCLDAGIIHRLDDDEELRIAFSSPTKETAFVSSTDGRLRLILADTSVPFTRNLDDSAYELRLQPLDSMSLPKKRAFALKQSSGNVRTFEWIRGVDRLPRLLQERFGRFDHDRGRAVAKFTPDGGARTDLVIQGSNAIAWRNGETGALVDVLTTGLDDTPLVSDGSGQLHARSGSRWYSMTLDDRSSSLQMGFPGPTALSLGFSTADWTWSWTERPELRVEASNRIWDPLKSPWLPGDQVEAFVGDSLWLFSTDAGVRLSLENTTAMESLPAFGPNPKRIQSSDGTGFLSKDGDSVVLFRDERLETRPRDETLLIAEGRQLRLELAEDELQSLQWLASPDESTGMPIDLPLESSFLEGDRVLTCTTIGDEMVAVTPLGFFKIRSPAEPHPGPPLGADDRRIVSPGVVWADLGGQKPRKVLVTGDSTGYRIGENGDSVEFSSDDDFTMAEASLPLLDDDRWTLVRRFDSDEGEGDQPRRLPEIRLRDRRRNLEITGRNGVNGGQLLFDQVLDVGIDEAGPWILTAVAEERLSDTGELVPARRFDSVLGGRWIQIVDQRLPRHEPERSPFTRRISDVSGTTVRLDEFALQVDRKNLRLQDGRSALTRRPEDRIFQLPSGVFVVDPSGSLRWIRNSKKWFP